MGRRCIWCVPDRNDWNYLAEAFGDRGAVCAKCGKNTYYGWRSYFDAQLIRGPSAGDILLKYPDDERVRAELVRIENELQKERIK